jgi:hypothetical protein
MPSCRLSPPLQATDRAPQIIFGLGLIALVLLGAAFRDYVQDDVFITYVYARNLADGVGFVFNPGEAVQGTTTPLWTLIMAVVHRLTPNVLGAGNLLSALLLGTAGLLAFALLRGGLAGAAAAGLIATSPLHYASFGMETLLYCALLMSAFYLWKRGRRAWAMVAAAALTWTRADGVVLGAALCLVALFPAGKRPALMPAIRLGIVYTLCSAPWFLFAWAYFGSPLPNTFGAKQELLGGVRFLTDGFERWMSFFGANPLNWLALPLIVVGARAALRDARLRPVVIWAGLYLLGYTALNISSFWYYTPLATALIVLAVIGGARFAAGRLSASARQAAALLTLVVMAYNGIIAYSFHAPPPRMAVYREAGRWISAHTPPDSTLLVADLGIAGYYARRRTIDSFGLIVPDLPIKTPEFATAAFQPDLILATQYYFWDYTEREPFQSAYAALAAFGGADDPEFSPMTVYQRRDRLSLRDLDVDRVTWTVDGQPFAALAGARISPMPIWSGGEISLDLTWTPLAAPQADWTVFVHLTPADAVDLPPSAQGDAPPLVPSSAWRPSEPVSSRHRIRLAPDAAPGDYALLIGWYLGDRRAESENADSHRLVTVRVQTP